MKTRNLDLGTDLLRKEQVSFPDIEERAYAYRKFYRENFPVKRTGKTDPRVKERGNASGHYSESRMMEGDFATLLSLYGRDGEVWSISRQGYGGCITACLNRDRITGISILKCSM